MDAPVIAHVRITNIEDRRFRHGSDSFSCGTDYVVDVLTTFNASAAPASSGVGLAAYKATMDADNFIVTQP